MLPSSLTTFSQAFYSLQVISAVHLTCTFQGMLFCWISMTRIVKQAGPCPRSRVLRRCSLQPGSDGRYAENILMNRLESTHRSEIPKKKKANGLTLSSNRAQAGSSRAKALFSSCQEIDCRRPLIMSRWRAQGFSNIY